ncbi:MAG: hypothetical protein ABR910_00055 [Acidobacteriaceae bacterium]|jgi:hypothetical protein
MAAETKDVYVIEKGKDKSYWHLAGVAFVNADGSLNVKLHILPETQFQVRDRKEADKH